MSAMKRKLACYVPALNPGPEFGRCLASISASTVKPFVLVVDDGSQPPISVDFHRLGLEGEVLRLDENVGHARAANAALARLVNLGFEYIARMDADDLVKPARFERQVEILDRHPHLELIASAAELIDERDHPAGLWPHVDDHALLKRMALNNCVCHPSIMHRTKYVRTHGLYPEIRVASDYEFIMRAAATRSLHIVPEPLISYRVHANSLSFTKYGEQLRTRISVQARYLRKTGYHGLVGLARTATIMCARMLLPPKLVNRMRALRPRRVRAEPGLGTSL